MTTKHELKALGYLLGMILGVVMLVYGILTIDESALMYLPINIFLVLLSPFVYLYCLQKHMEASI